MSFKYYEFKYFVPTPLIDRTVEILNSFYGGTDPYPEGWLSSVYFDSSDRRSITECKNGSLYKRKFRIRQYGQNGNSNCQLQIKEKELNAVWKYKLSVDTKNDEQWPYNLIPISSNIFTLSSQYHNLEPIIKTTYFRRRYRVFDYRITLDEKIHFKGCYGLRNQRFKEVFNKANYHSQNY